MPAPRRKNLLARRRRRQDDGEEEQSVLGDFEEDSLSEGSVATNGVDDGDLDGSDSDLDDRDHLQDPVAVTIPPGGAAGDQNHAQNSSDSPPSSRSAPKPNGALATTENPNGMTHSLGIDEKAAEPQQIQFGDTETPDAPVEAAAEVDASIPKGPRNETPAQRARREHQEYIRERNANPAFVPTRGGFFLHDDRTSNVNGVGARPMMRGRGRGYNGPAFGGRGAGFEPADKPWAHDLHETHETTLRSMQFPQRATAAPESTFAPKAAPATEAPNRSFSFTTVLGNVTVQVSFPGMTQKIPVPNVVRKHHTLLPQHRPPLRRDKPVRISIPNDSPRYIFPSTERSFIFIPRAMRPNQQGYGRGGRGRGSFQASRRPSLYGGSVYTPSIAMSRKSSIGQSTMREYGIRSPAESIMSRPGMPGAEAVRPIVRLPSGVPTPSLPGPGYPVMNGQVLAPGPIPQPQLPPQPQPHPIYASNSAALPMHQPRPQKAVSVADIESPASMAFRAPQQQQEQPFHQQVPAHISAPNPEEKAGQLNHQGMPANSVTTPLSQIPEGAVFAPGFQPYVNAMVGGQAYYAPPYTNGAMFYPSLGDGRPFGIPMNGPALAPNFVPGSQAHAINYGPAPGPDGTMGPNLVAHESNGMVYYYNPPMFGAEGQGGVPQYPMANGNIVGMANGLPGQQAFFYPSMPAGMFYPAQTG